MLGDNDGNDEDDDCRDNSGASGGGRWSDDGSAITVTGAGGTDPGRGLEGGRRRGDLGQGRHRCGRHREVVAGHGRDSLLCGAPERVLDADGVTHTGIAFDDNPAGEDDAEGGAGQVVGAYRLTPSSLLGAASLCATVVAVDCTITTVPKGRSLSRGIGEWRPVTTDDGLAPPGADAHGRRLSMEHTNL
jgi:hypothetical protein